MSATVYDFVVVGAGIVGLTVARELLLRSPSARVAVLDKEGHIGAHASGRNSGVLHCGIYYGSDTLKARVCARGAGRLIEFAREHDIPCRKSGKVILAVSERQLPVVDRLMRNARENGINAQLINEQELHEIEPAAAAGPAAIYCPDTAVIDSIAVLNKLRALLEQQGVTFLLDWQVEGPKTSKVIATTRGTLAYGLLFNCAGAHADTLARRFGLARDYALIPFKGIYWKLSQNANPLVRSNIYPVPDVSLPFLGVHLTRVINGDVYVGPTAIPALGRENYGKFEGARISESLSIGRQLALMYLGNQNNFRLLARTEVAKYNKHCFLTAARKLLPSLTAGDLVPTSKAGIRPQLINIKSRKLEMDYIIERTKDSVHVLNAISPAFTSSLAFAEMIVDQAQVA